jgi:hypothetical protein
VTAAANGIVKHYLSSAHILNALEATSPKDADDVLWRAEVFAEAMASRGQP